jgi:hypothetical protein
MLFEDWKRTDSTQRKLSESTYEFMDRLGRQGSDEIRTKINEMLANYPAHEIDELLARMKASNQDHNSAMFELLVHETLLRQGFALEPHPELANSTKRPDFLVICPSNDQFYLECILASENDGLPAGAQARIDKFVEDLNQHPHQNFSLFFEDDGYPDSSPSAKKAAKELHEWLDTLDPDQIAKLQNGADSKIRVGDSYNIEVQNWSLKFWPIPVLKDKRGQTKKLIVSQMMGGAIDIWNPIKRAVRKKGGRYGKLELPFVVAVNNSGMFQEGQSEVEALFGQENVVITQTGSGSSTTKFGREPNGAWVNSSGPVYTRVSGVWIFRSLHMAELGKKTAMLYFNPWASKVVPTDMEVFSHAKVVNDELEQSNGKEVGDALGLEKSWPRMF